MEYVHPTAERIVAAGIAKANEESPGLLKHVASDDFSSVQLRLIVEATRRLLTGVEPIDAKAIVTEASHLVNELVPKGTKAQVTEEYVEELLKLDTRRAPAYAHTVQRFAWIRRFKDTIDWANTQLSTLPDPDEFYKEAIARMDFMRPQRNDARMRYGWDTIDYSALMMQRRQDRADGKVLTLGWPSAWTSTWGRHVRHLRGGMVGLLSGQEGSGKTGFLEMIAEEWATRCHVVFVHMENAVEYTLDRRMARHSRVQIERLEEGDLTPEEEEMTKLAERQKIATFALQLHYFDGSGLTMQEIVSELRSRREEGTCDAVVLDYLNKVRPSRGQIRLYGTDQYARQADDLEQFKIFCETPGAKVVGFTAAQYNKDGKDKSPRKRASGTDIRGSGELMDKVQLAILLQRTILEADVLDGNRRIIAYRGQKDPVVKVRVEKQNRGPEAEFEQVHVGAEFRVKDKVLG